ncbi:glycosyltransferase family 9 protein [Leptospira idonii]|uniref:Lipopolysaccharide heptosyltransferase family protein n=1 Tax=Leptospira idonii TaxID=1193500 RepID=A0A4R9LXY4_9LEPT|nr:lipopolysaccharide heptosyltransferase family protein [Leptospira idonii]TGN18295.1 lipopolysaccharide heptosyltransferase family protein [Leptospira idonii]
MKSSLLLFLFKFVSIFRVGRKKQRLLVMKIDAIGDYILFRNFLSVLKADIAYKDYDFYIFGNIQWKEIYEAYDADFAIKAIWFDRSRHKNHLYLFWLLIRLSLISADLFLQPTHSRDFWCDFFSRRTPARKKISSFGDDTNIGTDAKKRSDDFFDVLLPVKFLYEFEFLRNREFFSLLLEKEIKISKPSISFSKIDGKPYVSIFLGASSSLKQFEKEKLFLFLKELASHDRNLKFVLLGSPKEKQMLELFPFSDFPNLENMCGKTSLVQLIDQIGNSTASICYDSSGVHIAVATGVDKVVCISNGNHYGRFIPYPKSIVENMLGFYPPEIKDELRKGRENLVLERYYTGASLDINTIPLQETINDIFDYLKS